MRVQVSGVVEGNCKCRVVGKQRERERSTSKLYGATQSVAHVPSRQASGMATVRRVITKRVRTEENRNTVKHEPKARNR